MKLERIDIKTAESWQDWKGYRGEVTFSGKQGKVQIQMGDELSRKVLAVCSEQLVDASRQVAEQMTAQLIEGSSLNALPAE